jgi:hypothetical protein
MTTMGSPSMLCGRSQGTSIKSPTCIKWQGVQVNQKEKAPYAGLLQFL